MTEYLTVKNILYLSVRLFLFVFPVGYIYLCGEGDELFVTALVLVCWGIVLWTLRGD